MKRKKYFLFIFILSIFLMFITVVLLWKYGAYEVSYGNATVVVDGGWFLISMNLFRVIIILVLCVVSGRQLFLSNDQK